MLFRSAEKSRRRVTDQEAKALRAGLDPAVQAVGVFMREQPERVAALLNEGVIDLAQLHGGEDESYLASLRELTDRPLIQAFRVETEKDLRRAEASTADYILLDHGAGGTGKAFDWNLLRGFERPYFLAGGLGPENAAEAVKALHPFAVDVSSGIETDGVKDRRKMREFVEAVRTISGKGDQI